MKIEEAPLVLLNNLISNTENIGKNLSKKILLDRKKYILPVCNKANFGELTIMLCSFIPVVVMIIIIFCKRRNCLPKKEAAPLLYYLAKTSFHSDHYEFFKTLVQKEKYDVNYFNPQEKLSLFLCSCLSGNAELILFMLEHGANVQSVSYYGDSAVYLAAYGSINSKTPDLKVLNLLLAAGCDINHQNKGGFTVLHLAALKGRLDLVRYLILHGADPSIPNCDGLLPVDVALIEGHRDIADFFISRKNRTNTCESVYF